jgi:hypothetical protein
MLFATKPLTQLTCCTAGDALSRKGRGHKYSRRMRGSAVGRNSEAHPAAVPPVGALRFASARPAG